MTGCWLVKELFPKRYWQGPKSQQLGKRDTIHDTTLSPPALIVQELCESRGGRPGLSVLTSLLVSVDVKLY